MGATADTGADEVPPSVPGQKAPTVNEILKALDSMELEMGFNTLAQEPYKTGPLPWEDSGTERPWADTDDARLYALLQEQIGLKGDKDFYRALSIYSDDRAFDPLTLILDALSWDGIPRAGTLFVDYLGAAPTEYTSAVECLWLCEAIARAYRPGAKCDYVPVLAGPGGIGKSTFGRKMALEARFFTDSLSNLGDVKLTGELIRNKWIVELAELTGISGRALEGVKAGLTRQVDEFRGAYCRRTSSHPRRAVFLATTNEADFIADKSSGARRFLPIPCASQPPARSLFDRSFETTARQTWAEVILWMKTGDERFRLSLTPEMEIEASKQRETFLEEDPLLQPTLDYLSQNTDHPICTREIIERALRMAPSQKLCKQISRIMTNEAPGWKADGKRVCPGFGKQRCWSHQP